MRGKRIYRVLSERQMCLVNISKSITKPRRAFYLDFIMASSFREASLQKLFNTERESEIERKVYRYCIKEVKKQICAYLKRVMRMKIIIILRDICVCSCRTIVSFHSASTSLVLYGLYSRS